MTNFGKLLILIGIVMIISGILVTLLGKIGGLGRLPGDIYIQRKNMVFYFPITTMLIVSIVLTILLNIIFRR